MSNMRFSDASGEQSATARARELSRMRVLALGLLLLMALAEDIRERARRHLVLGLANVFPRVYEWIDASTTLARC